MTAVGPGSDQCRSPGLSGEAGLEHIDLAWFQPVQGRDRIGETIRYTEALDLEDMERIDNVTVNVTAYHDGDLVEGTTYFYFVTSWYNGTESAPSNALAITTGPEPERENIVTVGVVRPSLSRPSPCRSRSWPFGCHSQASK